ncbi:MAG: CAP domain-containing protein [Candidatus Paceibacterota bacterium]
MKFNCDIERIKKSFQIFLLPCEENEYRAKIFNGNFLLYFLLAIGILKLGYGFFLYTFPGSNFYADITKTSLVELTNAERAKNSLPELTENPALDQAAYLKALDMAQNGYFNHISPAGINPWYWFGQAGYDYKYAGENLAIGFVDSGEVEKAWIASPTHKANIVNNKYKEIGIAVLKTNFQGNPANIVVQLFGTKYPGKTAAKPATATIAAANNPAAAQGLAAENNTLPAKNVLGASTAAVDENSLPFRLLLFFSQDFFDIIQILVYGSLMIFVLLFLVNFALKADFEHADLLAKAIGFITIMMIFALFDQGLVAALIPRNL